MKRRQKEKGREEEKELMKEELIGQLKQLKKGEAPGDKIENKVIFANKVIFNIYKQ